MAKFKNKYRIETTRLPNYDYSKPGAYFVTICTKNRLCHFGEIIKGKMILNEFGKIVEQCWYDLPNHYSNLVLDAFVIMPNHIHGIMMIVDDNQSAENYISEQSVETGLRPVSTETTNTMNASDDTTNQYSNENKTKIKNRHGLSEFVRAFKSFSSRRINEYRKSKYPEIWQKRFYEHIIRDEEELNRIRKYIFDNPSNWNLD